MCVYICALVSFLQMGPLLGVSLCTCVSFRKCSRGAKWDNSIRGTRLVTTRAIITDFQGGADIVQGGPLKEIVLLTLSVHAQRGLR